jgi:GntR family transcriptional regulator
VLPYRSTMLTIQLDRADPVSLHVQVASEIRRAIAAGEANPGDRLPPAGDVATYLGVNKNTVLRALRMLRDEGLLDFTRGRGVRVVGSGERGKVLAKVQELLHFAEDFGYESEEVVLMIRAQS